MGIIRTNFYIIHVLNSCSLSEFYSMLDHLLADEDYLKYFTKRRYILSWLRPRDFYKSTAHYITELLKIRTDECMKKADIMISIIMSTTKDEKIKKSFVWNVMKNNPILSAQLIPYASSDKIRSILQSDKDLIVDQTLAPFVDEISELKNKINELKDENQALQAMIE